MPMCSSLLISNSSSPRPKLRMGVSERTVAAVSEPEVGGIRAPIRRQRRFHPLQLTRLNGRRTAGGPRKGVEQRRDDVLLHGVRAVETLLTREDVLEGLGAQVVVAGAAGTHTA